MGAVPQARRRRGRFQRGTARGRQGCATRRAGPQELEQPQVAQRSGAEGMKRDTILSIRLPVAGDRLEDYPVREPRNFARPARAFTRVALAAAHVVADARSTREPWLEAAIDWDATIDYRRHLW